VICKRTAIRLQFSKVAKGAFVCDNKNMDSLLTSIRDKKRELDVLRPLSGGALDALQKYYDIELTYTSNAIEGNTLTHRETAEVIEHGITVGGKPLKDHLEAVDHYGAVQWMRSLASAATPINEATVRQLHGHIVARSRPDIAGIYSQHPRRIAGSAAVFPNPAKIPDLMQQLGHDLGTAGTDPQAAFDAHFRLTAIHPFGDGNGRTARLLMNLMLIRGGYPPIAVTPDDRKRYLDALEHASVTNDLAPFQEFMHRRLETTLGEYLGALRQALPARSDASIQKSTDDPTA
jgi:Fic family protein